MRLKQLLPTAYLVLIGLVLFTISGCTLTYQTADIGKSLGDYTASMHRNYKIAYDNYNNQKAYFEKLRSDEKEEPYRSARTRLNTLKLHLDTLFTMKKGINKEYKRFKEYTKGKSQISSKSEEWDMYKETKKTMKVLHEKYSGKESQYNALLKEYNSYFNSKVNPTVRIYKTSDYIGRYEKIISDLTKFQGEMNQALRKYQKTWKEIDAKFRKSHPTECAELEEQLACVYVKSANYAKAKGVIQKTLDKAKKETVNIKEIYTTFPEYKNVAENEATVDEQWKMLKKTQKEIRKCLNRFESLANALYNPPDPNE